MDLFKFMKNWTLPLAMLAGVIGYFVFANFTFLEPTKPFMNGLISFLTPSLIFAQLLLTFCKIEPKELVPRVWHGWLLAIQAISCGSTRFGWAGPSCHGLGRGPERYGRSHDVRPACYDN